MHFNKLAQVECSHIPLVLLQLSKMECSLNLNNQYIPTSELLELISQDVYFSA